MNNSDFRLDDELSININHNNYYNIDKNGFGNQTISFYNNKEVFLFDNKEDANNYLKDKFLTIRNEINKILNDKVIY